MALSLTGNNNFSIHLLVHKVWVMKQEILHHMESAIVYLRCVRIYKMNDLF